MNGARVFFLLIFILVANITQPIFAAAAADPYGLNASAARTPYAAEIAAPKSLPQVLGVVISIALSLVGLVFLFLALYAGFKWMTAQGNEEEVKEARDTLLHATGGLIVIVIAYSLTSFIMSQVISPITGV